MSPVCFVKHLPGMLRRGPPGSRLGLPSLARLAGQGVVVARSPGFAWGLPLARLDVDGNRWPEICSAQARRAHPVRGKGRAHLTAIRISETSFPPVLADLRAMPKGASYA